MAVRTEVNVLRTSIATVLDFGKIIIERCSHCTTEIPIDEPRREVFIWGQAITADGSKARVNCSKRCVELDIAENTIKPDIRWRARP